MSLRKIWVLYNQDKKPCAPQIGERTAYGKDMTGYEKLENDYFLLDYKYH